MTTITISVPHDRLTELRTLSERFGITPEDLLQLSLAELLARPDKQFRAAAEQVLKKNAELYRRLA